MSLIFGKCRAIKSRQSTRHRSRQIGASAARSNALSANDWQQAAKPLLRAPAKAKAGRATSRAKLLSQASAPRLATPERVISCESVLSPANPEMPLS